jgi:hypothetical protein
LRGGQRRGACRSRARGVVVAGMADLLGLEKSKNAQALLNGGRGTWRD